MSGRIKRIVKMEKWAISDLHIGEKGKKWDDFEKDKELRYFLTGIPPNSLRGVGDIMELWQGSWSEIYKSRRDLLDLLFSRMEYWIVGNHDADVWKYRRLFTPTVCEYLIEDRVLYMHGHQFDVFNSRHKNIGKGITKIVGWLEGRIHPDVDHWLSSLKDKVSGTGRHGKDKDYARNAISLARGIIDDGSYIEKVILGHIHRKTEAKRRGILYQNTGCWIDGKQDVTKIAERREL